MRKSNTQKLGDVLKEYIETMGMRRKLKEVSMVKRWEEIMGPTIAARTKKLVIKNKVLFVEIDSSVVRAELVMLRDKIKYRINEEAGEIIVEKIIFR